MRGECRSRTMVRSLAGGRLRHLEGRWPLFEGVIGWYLEKVRGRFIQDDVGQPISRQTKTGIAALAHYHRLEYRRIPALSDHLEGLFVPDVSGRNGDRGAGTG